MAGHSRATPLGEASCAPSHPGHRWPPHCYDLETAAGWSSQVARRAHNPKVAGSNPAPAIGESPGNGAFFVDGGRGGRRSRVPNGYQFRGLSRFASLSPARSPKPAVESAASAPSMTTAATLALSSTPTWATTRQSHGAGAGDRALRASRLEPPQAVSVGRRIRLPESNARRRRSSAIAYATSPPCPTRRAGPEPEPSAPSRPFSTNVTLAFANRATSHDSRRKTLSSAEVVGNLRQGKDSSGKSSRSGTCR